MGIVVLLIVVGNIHYETQLRRYEAAMAEKAEAIGSVLAGIIGSTWEESGAEAALKQLEAVAEVDPATALCWVWFDEVKLQFSGKNEVLSRLAALEQGVAQTFIAHDVKRNRLCYTFVPVAVPGERRGGVQITQSLSPLIRFTQKVLVQTTVVTVLLILFCGGVTYFLIYTKIRRPLEKLSRKAVEIGKGNLVADLEIQGDDELVHLAGIMNDMCTRLLIAQEKIHFENLARLKTLEQLRHTEKLSTVGQIAAGIAHEIGTPLNVVDGRAKMIIREPLERDEIIDCAKIIKIQAERITLIIRQLLDFSRKKKITRKARENIVTLIRQVVHLLQPLAGKQGVGLQLKVAAAANVHSLVDTQQIQQVFMNIIMNAIQATVTSGDVQVEVANVQLKSLLHTDNQVKEFLRIDIRDEGPGIPPENLQEIFTPFFTTKSVGLGTGLGLSIAREMMEEHGGWIEVHNRRSKGAEFTLFLKLEENHR
jgi:signal transduction histidine kinase